MELSNISPAPDMQTCLYILIGYLILAAVFIAAGIIAHYRAKKKEKTATTFIWTLVSIFCFAVAILAFISNLGIYRIILSLILLPLWYSVLFFTAVINSASVLKNRPLAVIMRIFTCICYLGSGILLEDGASEGSYIIFGLFSPGSYWKIFHTTAIIMFVVSILLMAAQIIWSGIVNPKKAKNQSDSFISQENCPASYLQKSQSTTDTASPDITDNPTEQPTEE